jgi:dihydroorotate dehydrogenase (NAD+) catalytic subunit
LLIDLATKFDLTITPPIMNAAGFLGFAPYAHNRVDLGFLGAFVTNPVSLEPRTPAAGTRFVTFSGGFLIHSGHPNPGLRVVIKRYAARWKRSPLPTWIHLLVQDPQEAAAMVARLEPLEGVAGFELGLPPGIDAAAAQALIQASRGERPLVVKIPVERAAELAALAQTAGADAVSLAARRGVLPDAEGRLVQGRLYGPALFPEALLAVKTAAACGLPVIAGGGIYAGWQAQAALECGAVAVQLDGVLWKGGWAA